MGNSGSIGGCMYTDQGGRIDDIKNDIYKLIDQINDQRSKLTRSDYNPYIDRFNQAVNNQQAQQNNLVEPVNRIKGYQNNQYVTAASNLNNTINDLNGTLIARKQKEQERKAAIDKYIQEYIIKEKLISEKKVGINSDLSIVNNTNNKIKNAKGELLNSLNNADNLNTKINEKKKELLDTSYTVAYFEHLLYEAFLNIFNAVQIQNLTLIYNQSLRDDQYSTDNTLFTYQKGRIGFFRGINTFLFYFYYFLIAILIYVVVTSKDTSILTKLTLYRLFIVILIFYPIFILRFQHLMYYIFNYLYDNTLTYDRYPEPKFADV